MEQNRGGRTLTAAGPSKIPKAALAATASPRPTQVLARLPGQMGAMFKRQIGNSWMDVGGSFEGMNLGTASESEEVRQPFKQEPWVFACVDLLSIVASGVRRRFYDRDPDDPSAQELPESHPVRVLFDTVNPVMDPSFLAISDAQNISLTGESFWFFRGQNGGPTLSIPDDLPNGFIDLPHEIWPVRGDLVRPVTRGRGTEIHGWEVPTPDGKMVWPIASTLQFLERPDNDRPGRGLGRLAAAYGPVAQNHLARRYQNILLRNIGDPGGIVVVGGFLSDGERERYEAELDEHWNSPDQAGNTRLLEGDAKYTSGRSTPRDMQYSMLLEANKSDISAVYQTSPGLLGADVENFATFSGRFRSYLFLRVAPYFRLGDSKLNSSFFPRLRRPEWQGIRCRANLEDLERAVGDLDGQTKSLSILQRSGVPLNSALSFVGMRLDEPIDGGDLGFVPQGVIPIRAAALRGQALAAKEIALAIKELQAAGVEDPAKVLAMAGIIDLPEITLLPPPEPEKPEEEDEPEEEVEEEEVEEEEEEPKPKGKKKPPVPPKKTASEPNEGGILIPGEIGKELAAVLRADRASEETRASKLAYWRKVQAVGKTYRSRMDRAVKRIFFEMRSAQLRALEVFAEDGIVPRSALGSAIGSADLRARFLDSGDGFGKVYSSPTPNISRAELETLSKAVGEDLIEERRILAVCPQRLLRPVRDCLGNEIRKIPVPWAPSTIRWVERHPRLAGVSFDRLRDLSLFAKSDLSPEAIEELLVVQDAKWAEALAGKIEPILADSWGAAAKDIAKELGINVLNVTDPAVLAKAATRAIEVAEGTTSVVAKRLRSDLLKTLASGPADVGTLQARVKASLKDLKATTTRAFNSHSARALTIARTEVGGSVSSARFDSLVKAYALGDIVDAEWLTSGRGVEPTGTVRVSHYAQEGETRVPGEKFSNGLTHPLQPGAPAGEIINCECALRGRIDEED